LVAIQFGDTNASYPLPAPICSRARHKQAHEERYIRGRLDYLAPIGKLARFTIL